MYIYEQFRSKYRAVNTRL